MTTEQWGMKTDHQFIRKQEVPRLLTTDDRKDAVCKVVNADDGGGGVVGVGGWASE